MSSGVSEHLRIELEEYDARIRTFIPGYEELVAMAASAMRHVRTRSPTIVDLGVGTGALGAACLEVQPGAKLVGIDKDPGMLKAARARLARFPRVQLIEADFRAAGLPRCDAIVASLALHHLPTPEAKYTLYVKCRSALRPSGVLVSADCFPAMEPTVADRHRETWLAHLETSYSRAEAEAYLASWADEDTYFSLQAELGWLRDAGLGPEVLWRKEGFAVVAAFAGAE